MTMDDDDDDDSAPPPPREGRLVLLSGPVAAGKTTVARALAPLLPGRVAAIEGARFWQFIAGSDRSRREDFHVVVRSMAGAAVPFAQAGFTVLLDFSMPPQYLPIARRIAKEVPIDYVAIVPPLEACAARAAARPDGAVADYDRRHADFHALFAAVPPTHVAAEGPDAAATAALIAQDLAAGWYRLGD
jgi:chloramphenicol 3-O-phosphotransferase